MKRTTLLYGLLIGSLFFMFFEARAQKGNLSSKNERLLLGQYMCKIMEINTQSNSGTQNNFQSLFFNNKVEHCDDINFSGDKLNIQDYFNRLHEKKDNYDILGYQILEKLGEENKNNSLPDTFVVNKIIRTNNETKTKNIKLKITIKEGAGNLLKIAEVEFYNNNLDTHSNKIIQNEKAKKPEKNSTIKTQLPQNTYSPPPQTNNKPVANKNSKDLYWDINKHTKDNLIDTYCLKEKTLRTTHDGKYYIIGFPEKYIKSYTVKSGDWITTIQDNYNKSNNEKTYNFIEENNRINKGHIVPGEKLFLFDDLQYRNEECVKKYDIYFVLKDQKNKPLLPYTEETKFFKNYYHLATKMTKDELKTKKKMNNGIDYIIRGNDATISKKVKTKEINFKVIDAENGHVIPNCKLNWYVNNIPTEIIWDKKNDGSYHCTLIDSKKLTYQLRITKNNFSHKTIEKPMELTVEKPVKLSPKKFNFSIVFSGDEHFCNKKGCKLPGKITGSLKIGTLVSLNKLLTDKFQSDYWEYRPISERKITESIPDFKVNVKRKYQQQNLLLAFGKTSNIPSLSFYISDFKGKNQKKTIDIANNKKTSVQINYPDKPFEGDYFDIKFIQPTGKYLIINGEALPSDHKTVSKWFNKISLVNIDIKPIPPFDIFYIDFYELNGNDKRAALKIIKDTINSKIDNKHKIYLYFSNNNSPEIKMLSKMNKDSIDIVINNIFPIDVLSHPIIKKESNFMAERILKDIEKRKKGRVVPVNCYYYLSTKTKEAVLTYEDDFKSFLNSKKINAEPIRN